jgi:hypothetical protein
MFDLFVCTNEVNYAVALGELRRRPRWALVVYDPVRSDRRPVARAWQFALGPWPDRLVRTLGRARLLRTAHVPHLHFRPRLLREVRRARVLAFLDDGLDKLRRQPANIDALSASSGRPRYLTFHEYAALPDWLDAFDVHRVCSLRDLPGVQKPPIDLTPYDHLFVESPGLDAGAVMAALGIDPRRTLCVRHPVPHKRGALPAQCATIEGRGHDLEATLLGARDKSLYFGSTMALVFALVTGVPRHNRVHVQLDAAQQANLMLPGAFEVLPVPGLRHPLRRALAGAH